MAKYAANTQVPVGRSKQQIEKLLTDWGINEFFFGTSPRGDGIGFKYKDNVYKFNVPTPKKSNYYSNATYQRELRRRWRVLYMSLKMELEKINSGLTTFEDQFLAMRCLPDGSTVSDFMNLPENLELLHKAEMPRLLTGEIKCVSGRGKHEPKEL